MKEDPDDVQKDMPNEEIENIKLYPILKEAYDLLAAIENKEVEAKKKIAKLNEERAELKKR